MIPHGGNREEASRRFGIPAESFLDFSASVSPLGLPEKVLAAISNALESLDRYPDPEAGRLRAALARLHHRREEEILVTNGATEALSLAFRALRPQNVGVLAPAYRDIERTAAQLGSAMDFHHAQEKRAFAPDWDAVSRWIPGHDLVAIASPNNPTGRPVPPQILDRLAETHPKVRFLIDEAFLDFMDQAEAWSMAEGGASPENVLVLRSFTKLYAIPGLRLGYAVASAEIIRSMRTAGEPWSVNALAQAAGLACLSDAAYAREVRAVIATERETLSARLERLGFQVYPSQANFLLARLPSGTATALAERLGREGILVRDASDFPGLGPRFVRLSVRTREENERLLSALPHALP